MENNTGIVIIILGFLAFCVAGLYNSAQRDIKINESALNYEKCIQENYHTTPMEYYWSNNQTYPECPKK